LISPYTGTIKKVPGQTYVTQRNAASAVFAGAVQNQLVWVAGGGFPAITSTLLTDLKPTSPAIVAGPDLVTAKAYVEAVNLPDLTVFETGGGTARNTPVYEASIFDPSTRTISPMAPPSVGRTYHGSAILLPDGSVATFGGDPGGTKNFKMTIEIFKPNYFFRGSRPIISSPPPTEVSYSTSYPVGATSLDSSITKAVLVKPMSTTHSTEVNQRSILLDFYPSLGGGSITLPSAHNIAPPGWYMLFLVDAMNRPSEAAWVHLS
jgi:hypothetical protein